MFFSKIKLVFRWYIVITKRFLDLVPLETVGIIGLSLASQVFLLMSILMPLKVIMILASEQIPSFFPELFQGLEIDGFIFFLALLTVLFFILHLIADWCIVVISEKASLKILENNKKVVLFEHQDVFAKNAYRKHIESLADFIFVCVSLLFIGILYPLVPIVTIVFILIVVLFFQLIYQSEKYSILLKEKYNQIIKLLHGIIFLIVFMSILIDILIVGNHVNKLIVIIAILLIRQILSKLSSALKTLINSYEKRIDINSIFFYRHIRINSSDSMQEDIFWKLLDYDNRNNLVQTILSNTFKENFLLEKISFYSVDIKNIAFFTVHTSKKKFLIKIFNKIISSQAQHEASLLSKNNAQFSLRLLNVSTIEECHCHLYEYIDLSPFSVDNYKEKQLDIYTKMLFFSPVPELLKQYERTHPFIYQRLNQNIFYKLYIVTNEEDVYVIKKFEKYYESILLKLEFMPKQIINYVVTKNTLIEYQNKLLLLHWGTWKIDTIGSNFPINKASKNKLKDLFNNKRDDKLLVKDIVLSALMTQFETAYLRENFTTVVTIIKNIIECVEEEEHHDMM